MYSTGAGFFDTSLLFCRSSDLSRFKELTSKTMVVTDKEMLRDRREHCRDFDIMQRYRSKISCFYTVDNVTTASFDDNFTHRSSRNRLPTESPLARHTSDHPLLSLMCRWAAVRKHSSATLQHLPSAS